MKYLLGILAFTLILSACGSRENDKQTEKISPVPSCIEVNTHDIKSCFDSPRAYAYWKNCIKQGYDREKCYAKSGNLPPIVTTIEPPMPILVPIPNDKHFQFLYRKLRLTNAQIEALDSGQTSYLAYLGNDFCVFSGENPVSSNRFELEVKHEPPPLSLHFDVVGTSAGIGGTTCMYGEVNWASFEFDNVDVGVTSTSLDQGESPVINVGRRNHIPDAATLPATLNMSVFSSGLATGRFQMLAQEPGDDQVLIISGSFMLKDEE